MARWDRFASAVGEARIIAALGGIYAAMATTHTLLLWGDGHPLADIVPLHLLIGLPGVALLYGGYRLPDTDLRPDVYSRIVARCLAGVAIMLGVVGLLAVGSSGGLNRPLFTPVAGTALGSVAGFAIGLNEARALSRAHEAEQHRDELLRERSLREGIVETSPIGIAVIDGDGRISVVNEHVAEMVGYSEDELLGLEYHASMLEPTTVDGNPTEDFIFEQVMETGEPVYNVERQLTRADGERIWLSVNGAPLHDTSGDLIAVVLTAEDVTERRERERELEERNERLERFASMLAHELRNPLTIGQIYSQQLPEETNAEAVEYVTEAFDRIEDMIDVMLVLTRGREAIGESTRVSIADAAREAWNEVEAPDATLEVATDETIQADETYVRHLFRNLFENAVEHGRRDVTVTVDELPTGFYVADDGPGISAGENNVFEAGYTTAADGGGTGLGLAFVRELAEVYGWTCSVTESDAGGAQFEFQNVD